MEMTKTSIHLLRQYNKSIPVSVFLVEDPRFRHPGDFYDFCDMWEININVRPNLAGDYFQDNKVHLAGCEAERLLLLDSDTFVFADVDELFEKYAAVDIAACTNDWVWHSGYDASFIPGNPTPLNSGVILCSSRLLRSWTRQIPNLHDSLRKGTRYPALTDWLYQVSDSAYNREELGLTICSVEDAYEVAHFSEQDCKLLKYKRLDDDLADFRACTKIFHSYSQHWRKCLSYL